MIAKHLHQRLISATQDNLPDATNLQKVVSILQVAFRDGTLGKECTWHTVVLITKGKRDFWGVGLVKVLWKAVASLLNHRITSDITYHNALHKFRAGRGTGTAAFKAKLFQQLMSMREAVLFDVFLDL